jgi:hypothetical protein
VRTSGPTLFDLFDAAEAKTIEPVAKPLPAPPIEARVGPVFPADGSRIIYQDREGLDWPGLYRFAIGRFAFVTLDEAGPGLPVARNFRINPTTLRPE